AQNYESDLALLTDSDVAILQIPVAIGEVSTITFRSFLTCLRRCPPGPKAGGGVYKTFPCMGSFHLRVHVSVASAKRSMKSLVSLVLPSSTAPPLPILNILPTQTLKSSPSAASSSTASTTSLDAPSFPNANCATGGPPHCEETHSATGSVSAKDALAMDPSVVRMMSYGRTRTMHTRERDYILAPPAAKDSSTRSQHRDHRRRRERCWLHPHNPSRSRSREFRREVGARLGAYSLLFHPPSALLRALDDPLQRGVWETLWAALLRLEEDDLPSGGVGDSR
ncbi:hypothetical protein C8F01DRAFT_1086862, partial [Mycena amicta]